MTNLSPTLNRRAMLLGSMGLLVTPALAQSPAGLTISAGDLGLSAEGGDQSAALQRGVDEAARRRLPLQLPPGRFAVTGVALPDQAILVGSGVGVTSLVGQGVGPILSARGAANLSLSGFGLAGGGPLEDRSGLLALTECTDISLSQLGVVGAAANGLFLDGCSGLIDALVLTGCQTSAVFAVNSRGLIIRNCRIRDCGNSGIRIWRDSEGQDGSIVSGNIIETIAARGGGNGQNGNGISLYRADGVVVSDNVLSDCAFTAIRLNSTRNCIVSGNLCSGSGEVAIFSEFGFSGSIIADNIIDRAATGIAVSNLDSGGRLATVSGNIVRNIAPRSLVNPDTVPIGIHVEADTIVSGNIVEAVPGAGIVAGFGPFLRNVVVSDNTVSDIDIGIGVSVVTQGPIGAVHVADNLVAGARTAAFAGLAWRDIVTTDLVGDAGRYAHVSLSGNRAIAG
jgi:uncharacterized secreted repeat protein (TIGR03808 family)